MAAVFDAFLTLYKNNVAGLLRIATEGTGVLPAGDLHPDLVNRLADEAAGAARDAPHVHPRSRLLSAGRHHVRRLPARDADREFEYDPEDDERRCVAVVEAFRRYGIVPEDVRTLSVDGLLWRPTSAAPDEDEAVVLAFVKTWVGDIANWNLNKSREELFDLMAEKRAALHKYLENAFRAGTVIKASIRRSSSRERSSSRCTRSGRQFGRMCKACGIFNGISS